MAANIYDGLVQQYKLSKTLRFELKPVGKTLDNIHCEGFLEKDKKRKLN